MPRRSKRLLYAQDIFPEANSVYLSSDLIFQILFYLDWAALFRLSQASRDARQIVKDEVRNRIRLCLRIFITRDIYDSFMSMLRLTGGALVGGTAYWLLTAGLPHKPIPYKELAASALGSRHRPSFGTAKLKVLIPSNAWEGAVQWMKDQGYTPTSAEYLPNAAWSQSVSGVVLFERPQARRKEYILSITCYVALYCVETDIISVALSSPFSCHTNLITGSSVISFFPKATADRKCLRSDTPINDLGWWQAHFHTCVRPYDNGRLCGRKCPAHPSRARPKRRTQFFNFHEDVDEDLLHAAIKTRKVRRYYPYCYNARCPRYTQD